MQPGMFRGTFKGKKKTEPILPQATEKKTLIPITSFT